MNDQTRPQPEPVPPSFAEELQLYGIEHGPVYVTPQRCSWCGQIAKPNRCERCSVEKR